MIFWLEKAPNVGEVGQLQQLQAAGLTVVPTLVLIGLEGEFYEHNNLAEQIQRLYLGVFGARLDETRLETACDKAEKLLRESYMLPERSDQLRAVFSETKQIIRFMGEAPFGLESGKNEALWAVKRLWASRWQLDAVLERQPQLAPPEGPALVQAVGDDLELDASISKQASRILQCEARVWICEGQVVRVQN